MTVEDNGRLVGEVPFDPGESRQLIERQRDVTMSELAPDWRLLYGAWGAAFLLGYGFLYLQRAVLTGVPPAIAGSGMFLAIAVALTVTARHDTRVFRGLRGRSALAGARVGWAFLAGFCLVLVTVWSIYRGGAPEPVVSLSLAGLSVLVIGLVLMVSASWEQQRMRFALGGWILGADALALLAGMPHAFLVLALGCGGGFLAAAAFRANRPVRS